MTVVVQTPFNQHVGNGVTTEFGFTFQLLDADDLVVSINGVVQVSSLYSIDGLGDQAGGSVTFLSAPANGAAVLLSRVIELTRAIDYQNNGDLRADTLDQDFDRVWQALQGQAAVLGGTIRAQYPETLTELPAAAVRANRVLGFDALGVPSLYSPATAIGEAENITFEPYGTLAATNVQDAIQELLDEMGTGIEELADSDGSSLIGFINSPAGSTARTVQSRLRDTISVKDFGAVGDGVADDTTAIQAALTAGGHVYFPPGTYRITASLNIPADTILQGAGRRRAIIFVDGAVIGATRIYGSKLSTNVMRIEVRGLGFKGSATALGALHFDKGDVVTIDGCDFYDFTAVGGYGVKLTNVYFWQICHCKFENIHTFGVTLVSAASVGCNAGIFGPNNDLVGNNQALFIGLAFDRGQNILVFSNDFEGSGNGNKAIDLNGVEGVHILQNYIELWVGAAIAANNGLGNDRVTIEQNVINANSTQVCNFNDTTVANDRITFRANRFADITGGQTCVLFGNTTNVVFVDNDPAAGVPADLYAASPRTVQALTGSTTWDPGSFADGASLNNNVTVTGAAVGDACAVSFSTIGTRNILITGHVSAANTVRCVLFNKEGSAVDLTSGTLRAWVFKT